MEAGFRGDGWRTRASRDSEEFKSAALGVHGGTLIVLVNPWGAEREEKTVDSVLGTFSWRFLLDVQESPGPRQTHDNKSICWLLIISQGFC